MLIKNLRIADGDMSALRLLRPKRPDRNPQRETSERIDRFVIRKAVEFCVAHSGEISRLQEGNFNEDRTKHVSIHVDNIEFKALKKIAEKEEILPAAFVQRIVSDWLRNQA